MRVVLKRVVDAGDWGLAGHGEFHGQCAREFAGEAAGGADWRGEDIFERVDAVGQPDVGWSALCVRGLKAGDEHGAVLLAPDVAHERGRAEETDAGAWPCWARPEAECGFSLCWIAGLQTRICSAANKVRVQRRAVQG